MNDKLRLILSSFLMLFVELALIRWIGSNVVYLSYFSNFVLMGSFLGIGLGFLLAKSRTALFPWALTALTLLVGLVLLFPVTIDRTGDQVIYFGAAVHGLPIWIVLPVVFLAVAGVMTAIAQGVAQVFGRFEPLAAYRLDILGSIAGIVAFSVLSFLQIPPLGWGFVAAVIFLALYAPSLRAIQVVAAIALIAMLGVESRIPYFSWSPYYKITALTVRPGLTALNVNGIPHQWIEPIAVRRKTEPLYFTPYQRLVRKHPHEVLIVGAGGGSDVAIALASGARHVDAVEIDPRIYQLGQELNTDRPYQRPNVSIHIQDGRAFLERSHKRYDLILLALPDSLVLVPGQSALRLESYLFTLEAIEAARAHLNAHGVFGMYNYYRENWLVDRYANTMQVAFGHVPCIDSAGTLGKFAALTIGMSAGDVRCAMTWHAGAIAAPLPVRDDYPFPYLRTPSIPALYLVTLGLIVLGSLMLIRSVAGPLRPMAGYIDVFFMGTAFLLLETKNVVQFALLFGTTWFVNALVFLGILVAVLAAVEVAQRWRLPQPAVLYTALFASLVVAWVVPPQALLLLDIPLRFVIATTLAFAPVFLANLVFAQRFRNVSSSTVAFGANLLGAMAGGVLEYSSLLLGYKNLLIVVGALYGCAFLFGRRHLASKTGQVSKPRDMNAIVAEAPGVAS